MNRAPERLPGSLNTNRSLGRWMRFVAAANGEPEHVLLTPGKVEIGQGVTTALAQIAADALGLRLDQVRLLPADTTVSPDEGVTSGSLSMQDSGTAVRHACAQAQALLVAAAAVRHGLAAADLDNVDGRLQRRADGHLLETFWTLDANALIAVEATAAAESEQSAQREAARRRTRRYVGQPVQRRDLPAQFAGRPAFIQDLRFDGMRHAAVLRHLDAHNGSHAVGPERAEALAALVRPLLSKGMTLVVDGGFAAVIADRRIELDRLLRRVQVLLNPVGRTVADPPRPQPASAAALTGWIDGQPGVTTTVFEHRAPDAGNEDPQSPARGWQAEFVKPWVSHASIGLCTALACWEPGQRLRVWSHCQGVFNLRRDLHLALGAHLKLELSAIEVRHVPGAGCYGHNGADDVAFDAARCAIARPGEVVRLQWTRAQEMSSAPFSPAMRVRIEALAGPDGRIAQWRHALWSPGHSARPGRGDVSVLLGATEIAGGVPRSPAINPPLTSGGGADRNAVPPYDFGAIEVVNHRLQSTAIRSSAFRGLGAIANVLAAESMIERIAVDLGDDPLQFRLRHLGRPADRRAREVLERAAALAGWSHRHERCASLSRDGEQAGMGMAMARYKNLGAWCCVVAQVVVGATVRVPALWIAVDVGEVINPDGVRNQIEGGAVQATSIALFEQVPFDDGGVRAASWDDYRILRFGEAPEVVIDLVDRPQSAPLGAGEAATGPTVAAIGNAITAALGVRLQQLPFTPERLREAIEGVT